MEVPYIIIQTLIYTVLTYFMMDFEHSAGAHHRTICAEFAQLLRPCDVPRQQYGGSQRLVTTLDALLCVCAPAVKWLWYTLLTLLTLLYYTYYGLLAVVLSPNLQVSSVASTLFYAHLVRPRAQQILRGILATPSVFMAICCRVGACGRLRLTICCAALQEPVQRLPDHTAPDTGERSDLTRSACYML